MNLPVRFHEPITGETIRAAYLAGVDLTLPGESYAAAASRIMKAVAASEAERGRSSVARMDGK